MKNIGLINKNNKLFEIRFCCFYKNKEGKILGAVLFFMMLQSKINKKKN